MKTSGSGQHGICGDCDDFVRRAIATKIIDLAKAGERSPDLLCEAALKDIRGRQV